MHFPITVLAFAAIASTAVFAAPVANPEAAPAWHSGFRR